jgi:hypothetical protein
MFAVRTYRKFPSYISQGEVYKPASDFTSYTNFIMKTEKRGGGLVIRYILYHANKEEDYNARF